MDYKLAILDDEYLIRKSILNKIDSDRFEVVFEGDDGEEFINYVKKHRDNFIDLLLIDVEMPLMNGLEVIEQLNRLNKKFLIIIISGHDDFKYLQKAIRLGVNDYILKPIEKEELDRKLLEIIRMLDYTRKVNNNILVSEEECVNKTGTQIVIEIVDYIETYYSEQISLEKMANKFFINRSHLSRIFKKVTDQTFHEYLLSVRIKKACELIKEDIYSITEISNMVGYDNSGYFSQVFKKEIGCKPTEYYKEYILCSKRRGYGAKKL